MALLAGSQNRDTAAVCGRRRCILGTHVYLHIRHRTQVSLGAYRPMGDAGPMWASYLRV